MERRHGPIRPRTDLPVDYLKMLADVFRKNFLSVPSDVIWVPSGGIYTDEIILTITLEPPAQIATTSFHASIDFDPKASHPSAQDCLELAVDALGALISEVLSRKDGLTQVMSESLGEMADIPFVWAPQKIAKRTVYLMVDKANPKLEAEADQWLDQHDPSFKQRQREEEKVASEKLMIYRGGKRIGKSENEGD